MRLQEEGKARRNIADTIETTEGSLIFLRDEKLLRPYDSPHLDKYPEDGKERADKNLVYWALARESYIGLTYNKTLVPKEAVPKNFDGLLHPQLKGKMGISIGQTSDKIIGAMIKTRSEEFVKKLKAQEIKLYSIDAPALVNNIAGRRDRRLSGDISNPHLARGIKGRAGGVGSHGLGADKRRQRRDRRQSASSSRGAVTHGGFSSKPRRTAGAGKILLRQRRKRLWI